MITICDHDCVVAGYGGSSVQHWQPQAANPPHSKENLYQHLMNAVRKLGPGGARAILWHQGESDITDANSIQYEARLRKLIASSRRDTGYPIPWGIARVSYPGAAPYTLCRTNPSCLNNLTLFRDRVRRAQIKISHERFNFQGPDTDTLIGPRFRNETEMSKTVPSVPVGVHFTGIGLLAQARLWKASLGNAFFNGTH